MNKLPAKFEIHAKYDPATHHIATLNEAGTKYSIHSRESLDNAYDAPVELSVRFVQEALDSGSWIMTKKLEEVSVEREMVFPFTFECPESEESIIYTASKGKPGIVNVDWETNTYHTMHYSEAHVKEYIKDGSWIVKSVGEKAEEKPAKYDVSFGGNIEAPYGMFGRLCKDTGDIQCEGFSLKAGELKLTKTTLTTPSVAAPQAPESAPTSVGTLAINVDTEAAVEAVERLRQAIEDLCISYESVIALQKEMKNGL